MGSEFANQSNDSVNVEQQIELLRRDSPYLFFNPERRANEVCLGNDTSAGAEYDSITLVSKRKGKIPVNMVNGDSLPPETASKLFPMFAEVTEFMNAVNSRKGFKTARARGSREGADDSLEE